MHVCTVKKNDTSSSTTEEIQPATLFLTTLSKELSRREQFSPVIKIIVANRLGRCIRGELRAMKRGNMYTCNSGRDKYQNTHRNDTTAVHRSRHRRRSDPRSDPRTSVPERLRNGGRRENCRGFHSRFTLEISAN